jgi:uncharacterized membrane protein
MKAIAAVVLPSLLMLVFIEAERSYALYESGVLGVMGVAFTSVLILSATYLVRRWRGTFAQEIAVSALMASGPFLGDAVDVQPNVHGMSMLLWLVFLLVAWAASACLILRSVVRAFRTRGESEVADVSARRFE